MRLKIINSFFHDMSTGTWAACVLVIALLNARRTAVLPEAAAAILDAQWAVFWLLVGALVVLMVTGGFSMRYWREKSASEEVTERLRLLWIKHVLFALVYGVGTVWVWLLLRI
jgi:predicted permease